MLEETLDQHEELRNRIVEANFKWRQAQLMVDYAFRQLSEVVTRWQTLCTVGQDMMEEKLVRYDVVCCTYPHVKICHSEYCT